MIRTYELSHESKTPLYVQLYEAIRADILSGSLPGGEKLPSKRALAEHLSLSKITVETAYAQLLDEGLDLLALSDADRAPLRVIPSRSANTMDVLVDVFRRIEEDDDLDVLEVQTSRCQVCGDEEASLARVKLVELGVAL